MARLRDMPHVFRTIGFVPFVKKVHFEINDDNLFTWAASLAYSWLFAIFPFFVFLLTLIPLLPVQWKHEAVDRINSGVNTLPRETQITLRMYLEPKLNQLLYQPPPGLKGILSLGLVLTIWAASGGLNNTMAAMNKCYDVENPRPFYKQRPLAVGLTIVMATAILAVVILIPVGTVVTRYLTASADTVINTINTTVATSLPSVEANKLLNPVWLVLWQVFRYAIGLLLMFFIVTIVYHFGPAIKQKWRILTPGAVFTVTSWVLLGLIFRMYVDKFGKYSETYGTVGGVAVLLLLFYLDALVLLIGAEINAEVDNAMRHFTRRKLEEEEPKPAPSPTERAPAPMPEPAPQAPGPVI
jgi:membrane protein